MTRARTALRAVALFAGLSETALRQVAQVAVMRTYAPGELLLLEGDPGKTAYFIIAGEVRIYRLAPNGREQVLTLLGPGHSFNTVTAFSSANAPANAETMTETTLFAIPGSDLQRLAQTCPEFALALLRDFADRLTHLTDLAADLGLRSVRGRLARFLLEQGEGATLTRRWTQDEIAAQLGTVRDVVGRTLRAFVAAGLIRVDRDRIALLDRAALEREAEN